MLTKKKTTPLDHRESEESGATGQADCIWPEGQGKRDFGQSRESQVLRAVCKGRGGG